MQFHERSFAYKFGVFLCIISIPSAILGLAFPTWKQTSVNMQGLFQTCEKLLHFSTCEIIEPYSNGVWFEVVRSLQIVSILVMFVDVIFLCRRKPSRFEGLDAFFIGLLLASGPSVYGYFFTFTVFGHNSRYSWGFILSCLSSGLAIIGSICMCGSEYTPSNRVEPYKEDDRRRQKKKTFSSKDWSGFPDHGSHVENDYYRDYYKDRDPQWEYLHKY